MRDSLVNDMAKRFTLNRQLIPSRANGGVSGEQLVQAAKSISDALTTYNETTVPQNEIVVRNEVTSPRPVVNVDMTPVANAILQMTQAMVTQNELLRNMIVAMTEQPAPVVEFNPTINTPDVTVNVPEQNHNVTLNPTVNVEMEPPTVNVEAPQVTVEYQAAPVVPVSNSGKPKRSFTIKHDDGTTSTVKEN